VGRPRDLHLAHTAEWLSALPLSVAAALREPFSARALVYALLLDRGAKRRRVQLQQLEGRTDAATLHEAAVLAADLGDLDPSRFLPLLDLAMPALREMSAAQFRQFAHEVQALIEADGRIDLFEFTLHKALLRHLRSEFDRPPSPRIRFHSIQRVLDEAQLLLSRLARAGHESETAAAEAFTSGITVLPGDGYERRLLADEACSLAAVDRALDRLAQATPGCKQLLLRACAETVAQDGELRHPEAELLRAIADTLDCPMPPLLFAKQRAARHP
jgi:hypothetical protein